MTSLSGPSLSIKNPKKIVIFLHGYGANGHDLLSIGHTWQHDLPFVLFTSPHAPFPCIQSPMGRQWFSIDNWNPETLRRGANEALPFLCDYIRTLTKTHNLTLADVALVGFSQGAMMAMQCALSSTEAFAGVVVYSGALLWPETQVPRHVPLLLIHGDQDHIVPVQAFYQAQHVLTQLNFPAHYHLIQGLGHGIDEEGLQLGLTFLKKVLGDNKI